MNFNTYVQKLENIKYIDQIVEIHMQSFEGFFLTFLGRGFLKQLYESFFEDTLSGIYIATIDNKIVGFLAYSMDLGKLYKKMLKHRLAYFAWYSFLGFLKNPRIFLRLVMAFFKPKESVRIDKYVELSSIGVLPSYSKYGCGSALVHRLICDIDFNQYEYIKLETDAENNEAVNKFYCKNGFELFDTYYTREKRKMNEYRYYRV